MPVAIEKITKDHYRMAATEMHTLVAAQILAIFGDTVTVVAVDANVNDDGEVPDTSFYKFKTG